MAGLCLRGQAATEMAESISRSIQGEPKWESEWEYPPVRLPDGTELSSEQVKQLIYWYWRSGQAREDMEGV